MKKGLQQLAAAALLLIYGCSPQEEPVDVSPEEGYLVVTDFLGKPVKVKEDIKYVGSLFAVATHLVAMLGEADTIVTIPQGNVRDLLFCEIYPEITKARVVKGNNTINIEEIAKKPRPDVFISNPEVSLDEGQMRQLQKLKTPIITLAYSNMDQQMEMVELVGQVIGQEDEARAYVEYYRETVEFIANRTANIPANERKSVYHAINELLRTDQRDTLSEDWLNHVGVESMACFDDTDSRFSIHKNYIPLEELLERNPDVIIINGGDVYDYIQSSSQLHNLKAFRNGTIYLLPLGISRWGHPYSIETPLAMLWTAKTIYPERFNDVDIEQVTQDFYRTFFDYELSADQLLKILSGRGYKEIKGSGW